MLAGLKYFFTSGSAHVIEEYEPGDAVQLAEIHSEGFSHFWSETDFERMLAREVYTCFVARKAGSSERALSGFVIFRRVVDEAEIITIAVSRKQRNKGIAGRLIDETIRHLQSERVGKLFLEVNEKNTAALKLYRSARFEKTGKREGYYKSEKGGNPSPALVMALDLG